MEYEAELAGVLEHGQLASTRSRKLPRRRLGRGVLALLVLLRVYVVIAIPIVGYAFFHAMHAPPP
jgi:hypothetical protein